MNESIYSWCGVYMGKVEFIMDEWFNTERDLCMESQLELLIEMNRTFLKERKRCESKTLQYPFNTLSKRKNKCNMN